MLCNIGVITLHGRIMPKTEIPQPTVPAMRNSKCSFFAVFIVHSIRENCPDSCLISMLEPVMELLLNEIAGNSPLAILIHHHSDRFNGIVLVCKRCLKLNDDVFAIRSAWQRCFIRSALHFS